MAAALTAISRTDYTFKGFLENKRLLFLLCSPFLISFLWAREGQGETGKTGKTFFLFFDYYFLHFTFMCRPGKARKNQGRPGMYFWGFPLFFELPGNTWESLGIPGSRWKSQAFTGSPRESQEVSQPGFL